MINLKKPTFDQKDIINECIENMEAGYRKNHILLSIDKIVEESRRYDELAEDQKLSKILVHNEVEGGASKEDMEWLYTNKFARMDEAGRKYYDDLKLLPPYGTCPLCGQRKVATLDHYLPKSRYPTYSVTPYNLIAACTDCNKIKNTEIFECRREETIHPYYDNFNDEIWLKASFLEEDVGFYFYVEKPLKWDEEKFERAQKHLKTFQLQKLYTSHASEEFAENINSLCRLFKISDIRTVKEDLQDRIKSARSVRLNTWKAAMYESLLVSVWFFDIYLTRSEPK